MKSTVSDTLTSCRLLSMSLCTPHAVASKPSTSRPMFSGWGRDDKHPVVRGRATRPAGPCGLIWLSGGHYPRGQRAWRTATVFVWPPLLPKRRLHRHSLEEIDDGPRQECTFMVAEAACLGEHIVDAGSVDVVEKGSQARNNARSLAGVALEPAVDDLDALHRNVGVDVEGVFRLRRAQL